MTYRAGILCDPYLRCDTPGCGSEQSVLGRGGIPSEYWLDKRKLRGWHTVRTERGEWPPSRIDTCPKCRKAKKEISK